MPIPKANLLPSELIAAVIKFVSFTLLIVDSSNQHSNVKSPFIMSLIYPSGVVIGDGSADEEIFLPINPCPNFPAANDVPLV